MHGVTAVERSTNSKLGDVSATYVSQDSCPRDCPFYGAGCYAEYGMTAITTRRLNAQSKGRRPSDLARREARAVDGLSGDRPLRLHVVGDCRTAGAARLIGAAASRYARRGKYRPRGKKAWTYSHAWRKIARRDWGRDVSVLASCESTGDARRAMMAGYAAAVVVDRFERPAVYERDGIRILPCPAQTHGVSCADCGLCLNDRRLRAANLVIGFEAHSQGAGAVRKRISLPTV